MPSKRVTAYKCSDGELFDTKLKAETHEASIGVRSLLNTVAADLHREEDQDSPSVQDVIDEAAKEQIMVKLFKILNPLYGQKGL